MFMQIYTNILTQITTPAAQFWYEMEAQNQCFLSVSILVMKFIIKHVLNKKQ